MTNPGDCLSNPSQLVGWYDADSVSGTTWNDKSINGNNGDLYGSEYGVFTSNTDPSHELYANDMNVVYGTTNSQVAFGPTITDAHTLINLCKYRESGSKARIIQSESVDTIYGFWNARSGIAYLNGVFYTDMGVDQFGTDWVLSSQTRDLYRGNQIDLTTGSSSWTGSTRFMINDGAIPWESSDWSCAEVIIIDERISDSEIICVEDYLINKYNQGMGPTEEPTQNPTASPTVPTSEPSISPTMNPTLEPTIDPTESPTTNPTVSPTDSTLSPTISPTFAPTSEPTFEPTMSPTDSPMTLSPSLYPTETPTTLAASNDIASMISDNLIIVISIGAVLFLFGGIILAYICFRCCRGTPGAQQVDVQPQVAV